MVLYLVRHGEAKREEEDPQRSLSKKGLQDIRKTASYAKGVNVRVSQIFHSGKTRALQTASVLDEYLKPVRGISATDGLNPLDDPRIFFERISKLKEDTMIIGHLPHLSRLAALILCNDKEKDIISFKTASILCLDRSEDGSWSIEWLISPSMIT